MPRKSPPRTSSAAMSSAAATTRSSPSTTASSPRSRRRRALRRPAAFILPALVNAHDHARPTASSFGAVEHAAGVVDPALGVRHAAGSVSRRRIRARALGALRLRGDDDPLHPAERHDDDRRRGARDRPRSDRCRHSPRLRACGARPEPDRVWRQRGRSVSTRCAGPQGDRGPVRAACANAERLHRNGGSDRMRRSQAR